MVLIFFSSFVKAEKGLKAPPKAVSQKEKIYKKAKIKKIITQVIAGVLVLILLYKVFKNDKKSEKEIVDLEDSSEESEDEPEESEDEFEESEDEFEESEDEFEESIPTPVSSDKSKPKSAWGSDLDIFEVVKDLRLNMKRGEIFAKEVILTPKNSNPLRRRNSLPTSSKHNQFIKKVGKKRVVQRDNQDDKQ